MTRSSYRNPKPKPRLTIIRYLVAGVITLKLACGSVHDPYVADAKTIRALGIACHELHHPAICSVKPGGTVVLEMIDLKETERARPLRSRPILRRAG